MTATLVAAPVEPVTATPAATPSKQQDRPAYLWFFLAAIVFSVLSGNSKLLHFPIGPDRICFGAGLVLLLLDPVALRERKLRLTAAQVALLLLVGWIMISGSLDGSLGTSLGFYALLDRVTVPLAYLTLAPIIFSTAERRDLLARCLVGLGLYLGLTAVFEIIGPHALVFPRYILDPGVGINFGQARGPFAEPEADGLVMCACAFVAVYGYVRWESRWRYLALAVALIDVSGVFLTLTRSVWIGTTIGAILASLANPRLRKLMPKLLALAAVVLVVVLIADPGLRSKAATRAGTSRSVYDRANTDAAALRIIERDPLTGVGWLNFINQSENYVRQAPTYPITNINIEVHNVLLGRAAELGIPAALTFVFALLTGPFWACVRRVRGDLGDWRLIMIGFGSCWIFVSLLSPLPYPLPNSLLWLFTGIVLSPVLSRRRRATEKPLEAPAARQVRWGVLPSAAPRRPTATVVKAVPRRPRSRPVRLRRRVARRPS